MAVKFNFNLKAPNKEESLLMFLCRWSGQQIKISTKLRVVVATWNLKEQVCYINKRRFPDSVNRHSYKVNRFISILSERVVDFYNEKYSSTISLESAKSSIQRIVDDIISQVEEQDERLRMSPIRFFKEYVEKKRIDSHTGRYISERTKIHQRTVIHRLEDFLKDTNLPDDFSTFTSKKFDAVFTEWCYSTKHYKQNTVYTTYGVLKSLLNAAKEEGFEMEDNYLHLRGKCVDTDAIYLTEDEIKKIYLLDIPSLIKAGEIDGKSTIERTRDLFIVACWTGLRRSDVNRLDKATFDIESKTISITAEKTKHQVVIPMHPMVLAIYNKYKGIFPRLCDRGHTIEHLRQCARLAGIDDEVRMVENRGGKVSTLIYKKYQLVGMHTGRRSFATNMYKRRFPTIAIMRLTGHTTESNFLKYIKVSPEENAMMMAEEFFKIKKPFEDEGLV